MYVCISRAKGVGNGPRLERGGPRSRGAAPSPRTAPRPAGPTPSLSKHPPSSSYQRFARTFPYIYIRSSSRTGSVHPAPRETGRSQRFRTPTRLRGGRIRGRKGGRIRGRKGGRIAGSRGWTRRRVRWTRAGPANLICKPS